MMQLWQNTGRRTNVLSATEPTCHGNHADLAACALEALEQNPPIRGTAETVLCVLQREYRDILKCCGVIEDPLEMEGWEDLFKWPKVHWADLRLNFREQGIFNRLYWSGNIRLESVMVYK